MRSSFLRTLMDCAEADERVWLLVGDLGYSVVEPFKQQFPDRFVNVGVAEQNMTGIASGLALSGKIVFTYSIANFPTLRCLEQIRNDVCYHNANVKIVAVGGGFAYGAQGMTHHAIEDIAIMRALPNMTVIAPGDPVEAALATRAIVDWPGPCYLRLGRGKEPNVHEQPPDFRIGKAIAVRRGSDITLIATGGILYNTVLAAEKLELQGIHARVLSMPTVKPLDAETIKVLVQQTKAIITLEEHSLIGGLGSAVLEVMARIGSGRCAVRMIGLPDAFCKAIGGQEYLQHINGLSVQGICDAVIRFYKAL